METVKFTVMDVGSGMCRVVPHDIRTIFRKIADGGCISSLGVLLDEMDHITKACTEIGFIAVFER